MELDPFPESPTLEEVIKYERHTREVAQSHKGEPVPQNKLKILEHFACIRITTDPQAFRCDVFFLPQAYPPSHTPLQDLKQIHLQDLRQETHHRGSFLILRAITPSKKTIPVRVVAEDENESVFLVAIYLQDQRTVEEELGTGSIIIVKEPYVQLTGCGPTELRVDHVSDLLFLPPHDRRVPSCWCLDRSNLSAQDWKEEGNKRFSERRYRTAIQCYYQALKLSPSDELIRALRLNLSLSHLKLDMYDAASEHLNSIVSDTDSEKLLFRKSQLLYHMQKFEECCDVLKRLCSQYPGNTTAKNDFKRAIRRLAEQRHGNYQFAEMIKQTNKFPPQKLDCATYVGPVAIQQSGSRGRGLFTTKDVKAGDLLLCEKAFAYASADAEVLEDCRSILKMYDLQIGRTMTGPGISVIQSVLHRIHDNPSMASAVHDLHRGAYQAPPTSMIGAAPVVDTFLVIRALWINAFSYKWDTRKSHGLNNLRQSRQVSDIRDPARECRALWVMASYVNHSCHFNAQCSFIGDMFILRASRDIPAGTEILIAYVVSDDEADQRRSKVFDAWGFTCDCCICTSVKETDEAILAKRKNLVATLTALEGASLHRHMQTAEAKARELERTYSAFNPAAKVPRLGLLPIRCKFVPVNKFVLRRPHKAIDNALGALEAIGFIIEGGRPADKTLVVRQWGYAKYDVICCWALLAGCYSDIKSGLESKAMEYAKTSYQIWAGESETFSEFWEVGGFRFQSLNYKP
ncbi:hypothetical protein BDV25DRAFT_137917 [Aspergillus avenaceus]|uniref:SET domain-containing protein n=1 Tax=Aspergillus avenaceus TaxID=36643 RepID=A0A5N6U182_ASPAV|nr:hypothetical protein BDV25DRAFT_137917 [Aspergillus avenaceus]